MAIEAVFNGLHLGLASPDMIEVLRGGVAAASMIVGGTVFGGTGHRSEE